MVFLAEMEVSVIVMSQELICLTARLKPTSKLASTTISSPIREQYIEEVATGWEVTPNYLVV